MKRRRVLKAAVTVGIAGGGLIHSAGSATASEVTSEITLPDGDARGLGVYGNTFLTGHRFGDWYYIKKDGSVEARDSLERHIQGAALGEDAAYFGYDKLTKYPYNSDEKAETKVPARLLSLAYDHSKNTLWGGTKNGKVWKINTTLGIEQTFSFGSGVFGLAHDGDYLWVGTVDNHSILQYAPQKEEVVAMYDYPVAVPIYDFTFTDGHLWLEGDDKLYETDINKTTPTPTDTPLQTPTRTLTPTETATESPAKKSTSSPSPEDSEGNRATDTDTQSDSDIQDSDGDGVIDSEDYAPHDPDVQRKSDVQSENDVGAPGFGFGATAFSAILLYIIKLIRSDRRTDQ